MSRPGKQLMVMLAGRWTWRIVLIGAIVLTIGCDRVTKHVAATSLADAPGRHYAGGAVWIGYVENPGGFLGLGAALPPVTRTAVFSGATGLMLLVLAIVAVRQGLTGWPALGAALFVAGGASNWIDRVMHGFVVDFLNLGIGPVRTGIFNVADAAIMCGAALFAAGALVKRRVALDRSVEDDRTA